MTGPEPQLRTASGRAAASNIARAIDGEAGYCVLPGLDETELAAMRGFIEEQWLARIREHAPEHAETFRTHGIARYHELSHLVDHATLWPKAARILPVPAVAALRATGLARELEAQLGRFEISNEEGLASEEVTWRLVRPDAPGDTGPVHADRWFWDLGHGQTPSGCQRVKIWVAVVTEPGMSGLRLLPGSHLREWRYHGELRNGFVKPTIDEDVDALGLELVPTEPGNAIVFNDRLLHGGGASLGRCTRVSFELTMFVRGTAA